MSHDRSDRHAIVARHDAPRAQIHDWFVERFTVITVRQNELVGGIIERQIAVFPAGKHVGGDCKRSREKTIVGLGAE